MRRRSFLSSVASLPALSVPSISSRENEQEEYYKETGWVRSAHNHPQFWSISMYYNVDFPHWSKTIIEEEADRELYLAIREDYVDITDQFIDPRIPDFMFPKRNFSIAEYDMYLSLVRKEDNLVIAQRDVVVPEE